MEPRLINVNDLGRYTVEIDGHRYVPWVRLAEALKRDEYEGKLFTGVQMVTDAAVIAAAQVFGMGPARCERFVGAMTECLNEISALINDDGLSDWDIVYTKEKIDRRMRRICGEKFEPWEVRYDHKRSDQSNKSR